MRPLLILVLSMLGACAATPYDHLSQFDQPTRRACPPGTFAVYVVNGFDTRIDGCADASELRFLLH